MKPHELRTIYAPEEINRRVKALASELTKHYRGKNPVLIAILKGAFVFFADLIRTLDFPLEVDFVRLASYGSGTSSSGEIKITKDIEAELADREVIIVEDIADSGRTIAFLIEHLKTHDPRTITVCALLDKPSRREVEVPLDYIGFSIPNLFIVGYGIDYDERYRNLPGLYEVVFS